MKSRRGKIVVHKMALLLLGIIITAGILGNIAIFLTADAVANAPVDPDKTKCDETCVEAIKEVIRLEKEAAEAEKAKKIAESTGIIYLTFDDGPGDYTNTLLDVLEKHNVKATFFVTGRGDDEIIRREYEDEHTIALHTWSHNYAYIYSSVDNFFNDLNQVADRVKRITGEDAKLMRFPGGSSNLVSRRYDNKTRIMSTLTREVEKRGYTYFDWNVDSDDAGRADNPDAVYNNVVSHLKGGPNVVLQHDIKPYSVEAVERIIEYGKANNFYFDKLDSAAFNAHHGVNN